MGSKPTTDPAALMDLIASRAPKLIAAGVTSLTIGDFSCTLAPPPPTGTPAEPGQVPRSHPNPLHDPTTYPGGRVPGFDLDDMPRRRR